MSNRRTGRKRELAHKLQSDDIEVNLLPSQIKDLANNSAAPSNMSSSAEHDTIIVSRRRDQRVTSAPGERDRASNTPQARRAKSQTSSASDAALPSRGTTVTRSRSSTLFADTPASAARTSESPVSPLPAPSPLPITDKGQDLESRAPSTPTGTGDQMASSSLKRDRGASSVKRGRGRPRKISQQRRLSSTPASEATPDPDNVERASSIMSVSDVPARNTRSKTPSNEQQPTRERRQIPRLRPSTDAEHNARIARAIEYCRLNPVKGDPHHPDTINKKAEPLRRTDQAVDTLALEPVYPLGWQTDKVRIAQLVRERGVSFSARADEPVSTDVPISVEAKNNDPTVPPSFIDFDERDMGIDAMSDMWIGAGKAKGKQQMRQEYPDKILANAGLPRFADLDVRIQVEMIENLFHQGHWGFTHLQLAFKIRLADLLAIRKHIMGIQNRRAVLKGLIPMTNELYKNANDHRTWEEIYDDNKASQEKFIVDKGIDCYTLDETYEDIPMSERHKALDFVTAWQLSRNYLGHTMPGEGLGLDLSSLYWDEFVNSFAISDVHPTSSSAASGQNPAPAVSTNQPKVPHGVLTPQSQPRISKQTVGPDIKPKKEDLAASVPHTRPSSYKAQIAARDTDSDSDLPRMRTDSPHRPRPVVSLASLAMSAPVARMSGTGISNSDRNINAAQTKYPSVRPPMQFQSQSQQQPQPRSSYDGLGPMIG